MNDPLKQEISQIFKFLSKAYAASWQSRWQKTPFMEEFATQEDLARFVQTKGKFETVPAHTWAVALLWVRLSAVCPNLTLLVDSDVVQQRILIHDLGETHIGDKSLYQKTDDNTSATFDERDEYLRIVNNFPEKDKFMRWYDELVIDGQQAPLVANIVRWVDYIQGDHFALTFGNNFTPYSSTIEKIVRERSGGRSKIIIDMIDKLEGVSEDIIIAAQEEVHAVMEVHLANIRLANITIDLSDLGF